jgi:integrase/recombinase XerD
MSELRAAVEDYLAIRRKLGFSLKLAGRLLPDFVEYLQCCGAPHVTAAVALAWATQPTEAHPVWWRQRLGIVRGFARHLKELAAYCTSRSRWDGSSANFSRNWSGFVA